MFRFACVIALAASLVGFAALAREDAPHQTLRLDGLVPGGARATVTEAWGTFDLHVTNLTDQDRLARVQLFYEGHEDLQYGRDLWVPARSSISSWLLAGPAPAQAKAPENGRNIRMLLYDCTDGKEVWIRPRSEERFRSRVVVYRKREPSMAMILDPHRQPEDAGGELPLPPSYDNEVGALARAFRGAARFSSLVTVIREGPLPALPEAFDGIDHLIVASNRIADDPVGLRALRRWLMRGGRIWVFLDRVDPDTVAPLLGDALDFQLVDRLSLTSFRVDSPGGDKADNAQNHERAVGFARVLLPPGEAAAFTVDGWPVWFTRMVGRGKVVFSTLGPRGLARPIQPREKPIFSDLPALPVPLNHLEAMVGHMQRPTEEDPLRAEAVAKAFEKSLGDEIGYSVIGLGTVATVFGAFLAGFLVLAIVLYRRGWRDWIGWLAPGLALVFAALFVLLGERSRRAAVPTLAAGQVVDAAPGIDDASVNGALAVYRPEGGEADAGAERGGLFELDRTGTEGQQRRFLSTDLGVWHWDGLSLPAGVRLASFRTTIASQQTIRAVARFGPAGVEGNLSAGGFKNVSDAVLLTFTDTLIRQGQLHTIRPLAVHLDSSGKFHTSSEDALSGDQFLAGSLLDDRQQRRQELYRKLVRVPAPHLRGRTFLLAWADPVHLHFRLAPGARLVGNALLVVPIEYRSPKAGVTIAVPGALVTYRRIKEDMQPSRITTEGRDGLEQHIRFQLPKEVLPMQPERVRLMARIEAPSRQVTVSAPDGKSNALVYRVDSPMDSFRVEIDRPNLLSLDEEGGLHLNLNIGDLAGAKKKQGQRDAPESRWKIRYLELEVVGKSE